ncbi:MAG: type 4a pilus biogenesis protein PilO [Deltaproteobacteria bacterium]|nr:type 4a pilus biogenesis protein PilO [Deltaproteobacteria bacterium]
MDRVADFTSNISLEGLLDYRKEFLAIFTTMALTFSYYQFIHSAGEKELKRLDSQTRELKSDIEKISLEVSQSQKTAERLEEVMENFRRLEERFLVTQGKLPSDTQISTVLKGLTSDELKRSVKFVSIKPLPIEDKKEYFKLPFQISLQARFQAFGDYLERLEEMPRMVSVENFRIEANEEIQPELAIQLYASTYVLSRQ